jgi:hypothetical protein
MVSADLLARVCCPSCRGLLAACAEGASSPALHCSACGAVYARGDAFLDLRPREQFSEQTKYLDQTLHADARHETVSPPLLSASDFSFPARATTCWISAAAADGC